MGEWLLSQRDRLIVARHEAPGKKECSRLENDLSFLTKDLPGDVDNTVVPLQRSQPVLPASLGVAFAGMPLEVSFGLARLARTSPLRNPLQTADELPSRNPETLFLAFEIDRWPLACLSRREPKLQSVTLGHLLW